ncbi:MAG: S9 family peptidase, partial [Isosphaeraceae bacterium]
MIVKRLPGAALILLWTMSPANSRGQDAPPVFHYPEAPRASTVEGYHGVKVADPYRPLEDPDATATHAWVEAENKITFGFLEGIRQRPAIRARLTALWDYEKYSPPQIEGGHYFFTYNAGLQNQGVLFVADLPDAPRRALLDPNTLSRDGTVALAGTKVSDDGKLLAFGTAAAGSDWNEWTVRDVATGLDLSDHLKWIKFSSAEWNPDGTGFFYGRFPEPRPGDDLKAANYYQKVSYHRIGTPQADDTL